MTAVTTLPFSRPLTYEDLLTMPEDGHRYELIDGALIVSPSPQLVHQGIVGNLYLALRASVAGGLQVVLAPFDVVLADDTVLIPDLIVVSRSQVQQKNHPGPPLLAIEVLSPSTRRIDLLLKRDRLQSAGAPSYWIVDPVEVSITVLELVDGAYVEVARAVGDEVCEVSKPYPLAIVPSALLDEG